MTPGGKVAAPQLEAEETLPVDQHTIFRALAARANYLAADRPDIMYSAKEVCRMMAKPTGVAMNALKRLARYLKARPRLVFSFDFQSAATWEVCDTNWAGCRRTRNSTSGGRLRLSHHVL